MKLIKRTRTPSAQLHRLAIIVIAVVVFAAGCSQSGDDSGVGSGTAIPLSSGTASASSELGVGGAATTQTSVQEQLPGSSAAMPATTRGCGGIVRLGCVPRGSNGGTPATTTTVASLSPVEVEGVLSDRVVGLVDVAVDACTDLLEFRCAEALERACTELKNDLSDKFGHVFDVSEAGLSATRFLVIDDTQRQICRLAGMSHYWELDAILSAKYGEEYYMDNPGFLAFRNEFFDTGRFFQNAERTATDPDLEFEAREVKSFEGFVSNTTWGQYLPDAVRLKLLNFVYNFRSSISLSINTLVPHDRDTASRILNNQNLPLADRECYNRGSVGSADLSLADILTSEVSIIFLRYASPWDRSVILCIENLCLDKNEIDGIPCLDGKVVTYNRHYSDPDNLFEVDIVDSFGRITVSSLFWKSMKYFCAKSEKNNGFDPNDTCHRTAFKICEIMNDPTFRRELFGIPTMNFVACNLSSQLVRLSYENAIEKCYDSFETFLSTVTLSPVPDYSMWSDCIEASKICIELHRDYSYFLRSRFVYRHISAACPSYVEFYAFERFWRDIPLVCSDNGSESLTFKNSECNNSIYRFCNNDFLQNRAAALDRALTASAVYFRIPIRNGSDIRTALCGQIVLKTPNIRNLRNRNSNLMSHQSQKILINGIIGELPSAPILKRTLRTTQLTDTNIRLIAIATAECASDSLVPSAPKCVSTLWQSCFDLLSSKAKYESNESEVHRSSEYVCTAAWIAELARMASVLSSSFPEDYKAWQFSQFSRYIADEATNGGILSIDEAGKASPNFNPEDLAPEVAEALTALGTSIAKLIQPYLPDANTTNRQGNI